MRSGADRLLHVVINTVGQAKAHQGQLFANPRATRITLLVQDGFGVWGATRRLHASQFVWPDRGATAASVVPALQLTAQQFEALAVRLPWQRLDGFSVISRC